jgi:hypothetical protein
MFINMIHCKFFVERVFESQARKRKAERTNEFFVEAEISGIFDSIVLDEYLTADAVRPRV